MNPKIKSSPSEEPADFLCAWRHVDGSTVTFSPAGWTSTDPDKATWLKAMNDLVSSYPAIAPCVRHWLEQECQLIEFRGPNHETHFLSSNQ
jgi:hypothetical protein